MTLAPRVIRGSVVALGAAAMIVSARGAAAGDSGGAGEFRIAAARAEGGSVRFDYRFPGGERGKGAGAPAVLVLVPGFNGDGGAMIPGFWADFADREGVLLLAPTFKSRPAEIEKRAGYYYAAEWSGAVLLKAADELSRRTGAKTEKLCLYGISGGAHFVHRFANWRPERVRAFVAYSAAWWDAPSPRLREVPALIMCGEGDGRYDASLEFFLRGRRLDAPWVWRGYRRTGHEPTGPVLRMAAAFLDHYLRNEPDEPLAGDLQTYEIVDWAEHDAIPEAALVRLPSRAVARVWAIEE